MTDENDRPYRHIMDPNEPFDFLALAKERGLVFPKNQEELEARMRTRAKEQAEETAALAVPCDVHDADAGLFCLVGRRDAPNIYTCPHRHQRARDAAMRRAEAARALDRDALAVRLLESGVPERHCNLVITGRWEHRVSLRQAQDWYPTDRAALLLAGEMGCGKSGALAWLLAQPPRLNRIEPAFRRFHDDPRVIWVVATALNSIESFVEKGKERPKFLWSDLVQVPRLVIDDIGRVAAIGQDATICARLSQLLGDRLDTNRDTYMTTNISRKDNLAKMLEPQVWDRLQSWCDIRVSREGSMRPKPSRS